MANELPANLNLNNNNQLTFAPTFQNLLDNIALTAQHTSNLITVQNVDDLDEKNLETAIEDLTNAQKLTKEVDKTRRALKRYLNGQADIILNQFDAAVEKAQYKQIASYDAKAKELKKDLRASRINRRWEDVRAAFEKNVQNYPIIHKLAPSLENFDIFRIRHPKLVNGAKSWKFGDKQMQVVNQDLLDISDALTDLEQNELNLEPVYQNAILQKFIANPVKDNYLQAKNNVIAQRQRDINLAKQREAEAKKKAAQLASQVTPTQPHAKPTPELSPEDKARKWLADYVNTNLKYRYIAGNKDLKAALVYELVHNLDNPNSEFSKFINGDNNIFLIILNQILGV